MKKTYQKNQIWIFFKKYYKYGASVFWINVVLVCVLAPLAAILGLNIQKYTVNAILAVNAFSNILIRIISLLLLQCLLKQTCILNKILTPAPAGVFLCVVIQLMGDK